jgi:hypothetical protein
MRRAYLSATLLAGACLGVLALAPTARAEESARLTLAPYEAPATLGSRAEFSAQAGALGASLAAAIERGGAAGDAWTSLSSPSSWISNDMRFGATWAGAGAHLAFEAGDRQRWTRSVADPLAGGADAQLAIDGERYFRFKATAGTAKLDLQLAAETSTTAVETEPPEAPSGATRQWITSRRLGANLVWRPTSRLSVEGGEAVQSFTTGWRGASALGAQDAYVTPSLAVTLAPRPDTHLRLEAEQILTPIDPAKFAAYAEIATPGTAFAPQPDRGWRYGVRLEHQLPGAVKLTAEAADWRLASVTDLGPVGAGEAPVGVGSGERRQVSINLAAPLARIGLPNATVAGEVSVLSSQVQDPFTRQRRQMSGEAPYRVMLSVAGGLPARDLSWSLRAQADGPQSYYQMAQVTNLGPTAGLGAALNYGAGPVRLSLEVDNLVGGGRDVATLNYPVSRAQDAPSSVERRRDDARAIRIALRRGL